MSELGVSRRNLICGFAAAGVAVPFAAACGGSDGSSGTPAGAASTPATSPSATAGGAATTDGAAAGGIPTSEIPVGGGKIFPEGYIVTQPTAGDFKAFSSSCTHEGATLSAITDGQMICPRHGSRFSLEGAVEQGPASRPLETKTVKVSGKSLTVS